MRCAAFRSFALVLFCAAAAAQSTNELVSLGITGNAANDVCGEVEVSTDGRWVVFESLATDLVVGDLNGMQDIFLRDTLNGTTELISVSSAGLESNDWSFKPSVSADGRFVAFESYASNLVTPDLTPLTRDIYVRDRLAGTTQLVSVSSAGVQGSKGARTPSISANGQFVVFASHSPDLVPGDTNAGFDLFVRDLGAGTTERVSFKLNGQQWQQGQFLEWCGSSISDDGRYVLYCAEPTGYAHVFRYDRQTGVTLRVDVDAPIGAGVNWPALYPYMTPDGSQVLYLSTYGDPTFQLTGYVRDIVAGTTTPAALYPDGTPIPFSGVGSGAPNRRPLLADGGRLVVFASEAVDVVPGDTNGVQDLFAQDRFTRVTTRISRSFDGSQADNSSWDPAATADGSRIVFWSNATDLMADPQPVKQIYMHVRTPDVPTPYCTAKVNSQGCTPTFATSGAPSASSGQPFVIQASQVINQTIGLLIYGYGPAAIPFQEGFLCIQSPIRRTTGTLSGGNPPPDDCSGVLAFDFNAWIASSGDPLLGPGGLVYAQFWYRDLQYPIGVRSGLSAGLEFAVGP